MLERLTEKLSEQKKTLLPPTKVCKLCFKEISGNSTNSLLKPHYSLCFDCYKKLNPKFTFFKTNGVKCLAIYEYDENLKGLIYQFKGCYDFELKDIFLDRFKRELKLYFSDYILFPVPSCEEDNKIRGFNHVFEIYSTLGLKMDTRIVKTEKVKQSDRNAKEREKIKDSLKLNNQESLKGKKVLIVDDIFTTGSTIKSCINLLKPLKPKKIKVLVICKTRDLPNIDKTNTN